MSEERRISELETAHVTIGNKVVMLSNSEKNMRGDIDRLNSRYHALVREYVNMKRELAELATRVDGVENSPLFTRHNIWSRLLGWHRDR